ncbi:MAG: succinate dehydrogenase, partial [Desulfuromonas sp.]
MRWYTSSLGKKFIMGITGLLMVGFVVAHMLGNL